MSTQGLHLLTGPDRARKLQRIHEIERNLKISSLDTHHLSGAASSPAELLSLCRQQPAAGSLRLVIVDDAQRLGAEAVEALLAHAQIIAYTACVVFLVEVPLPAKHPLAGARAQLKIEDFPERDVPEIKPFALAEALGQRDVARSLMALHDQLTAGREPIEILGLLAWQVQRWVTVRRLLDLRLSPERIAQTIGGRSWQIERIRSELSGRPLGVLRAHLARCCQLDAELKSSRTVPVLALEQLVIELCEAREEKVTSSRKSGLAVSRGAI